MLWSTFLTALVIAHLILFAMLAVGQWKLDSWLTPALGLLATMLFGIVAINAQQIETVADNGSIVTTSETALGIYAFGLAIIAFLLTIRVLIEWLPTQSIGGRQSGF